MERLHTSSESGGCAHKATTNSEKGQAATPDTALPSQIARRSSPGDIADVRSRLTFADLPFELRDLIWRLALPGPRVFHCLVWASSQLKMQLLERAPLKMPLAHVCFESRRVIREAGYVLAFGEEDEPDDPGVWFNPSWDIIDRTLWGPGDFMHAFTK
ncbi:hypothetical protein F5Y15DRAFT_357009 [Xylariaceae sp. FL0016]|nr:hypothetical protein F5Y15DRAFT_357009 [Xylariaceae sp. FL0016]